MEFKALDKFLERKRLEKEKMEAKKKAAKEKLREKKKEETRKKELKRKREKYKPIHKKNLRKRQNARAYKKRKKALMAKRKAAGDVRGYYRVVIMHDREQVGELQASWWLHTAMERFNDYIKKHNEGVICEKRYKRESNGPKVPFIDEILVLKRINPEIDDGVRSFRNKDGMFVEHAIENNKKYAIIAKHEIYTPETFHVYGHNPLNDKKTGRWILENIINKDCSRENFKNVMRLNNKLIVQYTDDFDMVVCGSPDECLRLYEGLKSETDKKNRFVQYSGIIVNSMIPKYYDMIEEKTGWTRSAIVSTRT